METLTEQGSALNPSMDLEPRSKPYGSYFRKKNHFTANRHFRFNANIEILEIDRAKIGNSYFFLLTLHVYKLRQFYSMLRIYKFIEPIC